MASIQFEWDDKKNALNIRKHQISFDEAKTVFYDPNALLISDPDHTDDEERFVLMGISKSLKILIVCHCYREDDEIIRIISARKANKVEQDYYGRQQ